MIYGTGIVGLIVSLIVLCIVYFLLKYLIDRAPIPDKAKEIISWVLLACCILWLISLLLGFAGHPLPLRY